MLLSLTRNLIITFNSLDVSSPSSTRRTRYFANVCRHAMCCFVSRKSKYSMSIFRSSFGVLVGVFINTFLRALLLHQVVVQDHPLVVISIGKGSLPSEPDVFEIYVFKVPLRVGIPTLSFFGDVPQPTAVCVAYNSYRQPAPLGFVPITS